MAGTATPLSKHGRRYTDAEKAAIMAARKTHTWAEIEEKYGVSQQSMARWLIDA